jgi:hypothetical protein
MAQVVSNRPLPTEAWVCARVNPCGICDVQSDTGTVFLQVLLSSPSIFHSTVALQTHIIWEMRNMLAKSRRPRLGVTPPPPNLRKKKSTH